MYDTLYVNNGEIMNGIKRYHLKGLVGTKAYIVKNSAKKRKSKITAQKKARKKNRN